MWTSFTSTNVKLRLRFDLHLPSPYFQFQLTFNLPSPDFQLTFTWSLPNPYQTLIRRFETSPKNSPEIHLTFTWPPDRKWGHILHTLVYLGHAALGTFLYPGQYALCTFLDQGLSALGTKQYLKGHCPGYIFLPRAASSIYFLGPRADSPSLQDGTSGLVAPRYPIPSAAVWVFRFSGDVQFMKICLWIWGEFRGPSVVSLFYISRATIFKCLYGEHSPNY